MEDLTLAQGDGKFLLVGKIPPLHLAASDDKLRPVDGMRIRPTGEGKPILVSAMSAHWDNMFALIMPMSKSQTEFEFINVPPNPTFIEPQ